MKEILSFAERAKRGMELLANQKPVTLEEAKAQVLWLRSQSKLKNKNMTGSGIDESVNKFPVKNERGFTQSELNELLKEYPDITIDDLLEQLGDNENDALFDKRDVSVALRRCGHRLA